MADSSSTSQYFNFWILSRHEKHDYMIPQFPVLDIELVKLVIEDGQQYRYDGFVHRDALLDTLQFPVQVRMSQKGGFMLQVLLH